MGEAKRTDRGTVGPLPARLAVARPRTALAAWALCITALALLGTGVEGRLTQSIFVLPGTETERATRLASAQFGESVFVPVLLEGPASAIDRQGPALVGRIAAEPGWRALSPWDRGPSARSLRPSPREAMIVVAVSGPFEQIFDATADRVRELVDASTAPPVDARITGMPVIGNAIKDETYSAARHAERVAIPILLVVLLLVFRAPTAALFPAITGLAAVLASSGVIWLLAGSVAVDPIAISLSSMMGLALGVDYSLLIVTRFREEMTSGRSPPDAASAAMATAGRTVGFAGAALAAAMVVGMIVSPGDILVSAAIGVLTATVLGVGSAFVAIPAALSLLGSHLDRWSLGRPRPAARPRWMIVVRGVLAHPGLTALLVTVPLLLLTVPAFGLETGPPDVSQLPEGNRARTDYERVSAVMGPGWAAPFEVLVVEEEGAITEPRRLRRLEAWQRRLARSDDVATVVGPGTLAARADRARRGARSLARADESLDRGARGLRRLARGIGEAEMGARELAAANAAATAAVAPLRAGSEDAAAGADDIEARLAAVAGGTELIAEAVDRLAASGDRLVAALETARAGSSRIVEGLGEAKDRLRLQLGSGADVMAFGLRAQGDEVEELRPRAQQAQDELRTALEALDAMVSGRGDPEYERARDAVEAAYAQVAGSEAEGATDPAPEFPSLDTALELTQSRILASAAQADQLADGARALSRRLDVAQRGLTELRGGLGELGTGAGRLGEGAVQIEDALGRLHGGVVTIAGGAERLAGGLSRLAGGAAGLESGLLGEGGPRIGALVFGLGEAGDGARRLRRRSARFAERPFDRVAGVFDSGYFVLAAVDSAPPDKREQAAVALNVDSGGEAGRVLVVPESGPNDDRTQALRATLSARARRLGDDLGAEAAVGGTAAALAEYDATTSDRLLLLIVALAAVSYLILIPIFRSFLLPAIAVALNLVSVGAAFGALALFFQGDDPLLGGPGYLDAVSVSAIYTVIFGLSLDYQVFLISRMREGRERRGDHAAAIAYGLERTGAVVTGAAAIMVAVFVAFALTEVAGTRQFGAGMVVAVIIDATLVRLLLLPATMRLAGDACWAGPRWLAGGAERRRTDGGAGGLARIYWNDAEGIEFPPYADDAADAGRRRDP